MRQWIRTELWLLLSQLVSNVPMAARCRPLVRGPGTSMELLLALCESSTIAGNLLLFNAVSDVIEIR